MGMLDRFKKKKGESSGPTEDSFDLDDEALFGGDSSEEAGSDFGDLDLGGGGDDFGTLGDEGDLGAAATADFEDLGDLGGDMDESPPLDDFGAEFGEEDFGLGEEEAPAKGKKRGKKAKKAKAPRRIRRGAGRKNVLVGGVALLVLLAVGFFTAGPIKDRITGDAARRARLIELQQQIDAAGAQLKPMRAVARIEEIDAMQKELDSRRSLMQGVDEITTKVADLEDQKTARDKAVQEREHAGRRLALRRAELANIKKQVLQVDNRVEYLTGEAQRLEQLAQQYDAHAREVQQMLPELYVQQATAQATRTLSVQAIVDESPAE